jgi:hypothetical protein
VWGFAKQSRDKVPTLLSLPKGEAMSRIHQNRKRRGHRPLNSDNWQICQVLGKCESEGLLVQYLQDLVMNGDGETWSFEDGGATDTVLDGPFDKSSLRRFRGDVDYNGEVALNRSEKRYAAFSCGAILHETSNGFLSATWFPNTEKGRADFANAQSDLAATYSHDDEDEEQDGEDA